MISSGIEFKNFTYKKKLLELKIKQILKLLIKENNEVIHSLSKIIKIVFLKKALISIKNL